MRFGRMSEKIGGMGAYETHVTVRCPDRTEPARLGSRAAARKLQVTHIVLARGLMPSQPMPTLPDRDGHRRLLPEPRTTGFDPVRVKVATVPWTAEPAGRGGGCFEHHRKLLLPGGFDRSALESLVTPCGAHLSWNARREQGEGRQERFVTQRWRGAGAAAGAGAACDAPVGDVVAAGQRILSQEREFVLYDSGPSVDDGWMEEGAR